MPLQRLQCEVQNYAWGKIGSDSKVARFKQVEGTKIDESKPYAEYWFGTHPKAPSCVVGIDGKSRKLSDWLAARPKLLGALKDKKGNLPFLFKVLSVNQALSIQAHPNKSLARILHARDKEHYRDDNHKPEMAIALTDFEAMCGFRPTEEIIAFAKSVPEFRSLLNDEALDSFKSKNEEKILKLIFRSWMSTEKNKIEELTSRLTSRLENSENLSAAEQLALRLSKTYPGDIGIFAAFVLNFITMKPGDGIFLRANMPHSYLKGDIVECMACSDNVVRAGLTPKFRDVETLVNMLDYRSVSPQDLKMRPSKTESDCAILYTPDDRAVNEFEVLSVTVPSGKSYKLKSYTSPCVILIHGGVGSAVHEDDDDEIVLQEGMVFLLPAGQTATIRATPHMPVRLFSARCRESLYNEEEEEEEESSKEEKVDTGMILSPPSLSDLEKSRAFRPIEAPLWCVATCLCPDMSELENRPIVVVGGGGGSSKTGISNQVIVGHVGKKQGRVGLVGTFTLNLDQLPSSIAIGSSSFDEKGSCLVAFTVGSKLRLCKLLEGRRLVPVATLSLSENDDGDSSDSNPIDFCNSHDLLAAASGNKINIFKIQSGHRVHVLTSLKLKSAVLDLAFHPSGTCIAVGCSDGTFRILSCADGHLICEQADTAKHTTCSTCQWYTNEMLLITWSGEIKITGIARKRKVTQEPSFLAMMSCSQDFSKWKLLDRRAIPRKIPVRSSCLSPDGKFVALGHKDGTVSIWSVGQGIRCIRVFPKHHDFAVNDIVFFGSQKTSKMLTPPILTVSGDGMCRMHPTTPPRNNFMSVMALLVLILAFLVPLLCKFEPEYVPESLVRVFEKATKALS